MNNTKRVLIALVFLFVCGLLPVHAEEMPKPYVGSEAFERMKQLVGTWEGTMDMGKGPQKMKTEYRLTSGGSAIVETFSVGSPHEMVSVYHDNAAKKLSMTHYCMIGNQPKMVLKSMDANSITLDLAEDAPINVSHDQHMHGATIVFNDKDTVTQRWTGFEKGKENHVVQIHYQRVQ